MVFGIPLSGRVDFWKAEQGVKPNHSAIEENDSGAYRWCEHSDQ